MENINHQIVRDFFATIPNGELPDSMLTSDMQGWTTLQGWMDKAAYQNVIKILGQLFSPPISFTITSLTAEDDRVAAEIKSEGTLINGEDYQNSYVFIFRVRDGRIASVAEHFNPIIVQKKLIPLMETILAKDSK